MEYHGFSLIKKKIFLVQNFKKKSLKGNFWTNNFTFEKKKYELSVWKIQIKPHLLIEGYNSRRLLVAVNECGLILVNTTMIIIFYHGLCIVNEYHNKMENDFHTPPTKII